MLKQRGWPALGCAVAVATWLLGCGERPRDRDTAVVALNDDLDFANILLTSNAYMQEVLLHVLFLPLVHYSPKLEYQPALAESFTLEDDSAVTFRLRRDIFWHDGVQTTAHDVAFTMQRAADSATAFPNADWLTGWGAPQVIDSFTVRFPLQRMSDPLAGVALFPIMPRHLLDSIPAARMREAAFNKNPVGNGAFRFVEYRAGDRWVFERNQRHPEAFGRPLISRLVLRIIPDGLAQVAELRAGSVDLALFPPLDQYRALDADSALRGIVRESRNYAFIPWNSKRQPLNDARVRRGLTAAIDRNEILTLLRAGQGAPAPGPVGAYHWAFDAQLTPLPYAPDSARVLFAQAGLRDRDGDGFLEKPDGTTWQIEMLVPTGSELSANAAEMMRADLRAVGVHLVTRLLEFSVIAGQLTSPERPFDAALLGWSNDLRLNFHDMFHSAALNGGYQFASYRNPVVDSLIERASAEPDREVARPLWQRFQAILRNDQPWTFLYYYPDLVVAREDLRDVEMDVRGVFVNVSRWRKQR
jgi:peptide/nickel transport system substrate-binding protein